MPTKKQLQAEIARLKRAKRAPREPDLSHIGGFIQTARESLGMGIRDLADMAGINPGLVHRCETGGGIEIKTLFRLCKGLATPPSTILAQMEKKNPSIWKLA